LIFILFISETEFSQTKSKIQNKVFFPEEIIDKKLKEKLKEEKDIKKLREFILEDAIDPDKYIIGPGDLILINLWGEKEDVFEVTVLPSGNITIPSIGSLMVNGLTLKELDELIKEGAKKYYPEAQITVSLGDIRYFKVHITGEVVKRGSYDVSPVDRVSQVINMAEGVTSWANRKRIEIKHLDGTTDICDLLEYENKGSIQNNPFVRGGDIIYIPRLNLSQGMVFVSGNVGNPGYYQFYKNEAIGDFIQRINIVMETTDWESSFIQREVTASEKKIITIPIDFIESKNVDNVPEEFLLKNNDYVYLPRRINEVYVYGAVREAGAYPFYSNMKSSDYAGLAGKIEKAASDSKIKVIKKDSNKVMIGGDVIIERGDKIEIPLKRMESFKDYIQIVGPITSLLIAAKAIGIIK
jgi:protein involved in polysaccharide export with SLBB domain